MPIFNFLPSIWISFSSPARGPTSKPEMETSFLIMAPCFSKIFSISLVPSTDRKTLSCGFNFNSFRKSCTCRMNSRTRPSSLSSAVSFVSSSNLSPKTYQEPHPKRQCLLPTHTGACSQGTSHLRRTFRASLALRLTVTRYFPQTHSALRPI